MSEKRRRGMKGGLRVAFVVPRTPPMTSRPGLARLWASSPRLRKSIFHAPLPSLSLLALAGHTPDGFRLRYLDENFQTLPTRLDCDIAAITSITCQAPRAYALASRFRKGGAHVVLGGVHPTVLPAEAAGHADTVIVGEARGLWEQFLEDCVEGRPKSLYRPGEGKACGSGGLPGYGLLQPSRHRTVPVQLGSGCAWNCDYCSVAAVHGQRYRRKRLARVLEELKFIRSRWKGSPVRIFFVDDRLRFQGEYMGRLLEELASLGLEWVAQADISALSSERLVRQISRAGCRRLLVSVDPDDGRGSDARRRPERWEEGLAMCSEALRRVRRHGMELSVMFMLGRDGDGLDLFRRLEDFLREMKVSDVLAAIQTPLPGTALYRRLRRQGRIAPGRSWSRFNFFSVVYRPSGSSPQQVAAAQTRLLRTVYG
jgi:radical SAM superfamily enzyme YgiQ (UPF0313 family)